MEVRPAFQNPGTPEWLKHAPQHVASAGNRVIRDLTSLPNLWAELHQARVWELVGEESWATYCKKVLGFEASTMDALLEALDGPGRPSEPVVVPETIKEFGSRIEDIEQEQEKLELEKVRLECQLRRVLARRDTARNPQGNETPSPQSNGQSLNESQSLKGRRGKGVVQKLVVGFLQDKGPEGAPTKMILSACEIPYPTTLYKLEKKGVIRKNGLAGAQRGFALVTVSA